MKNRSNVEQHCLRDLNSSSAQRVDEEMAYIARKLARLQAEADHRTFKANREQNNGDQYD